MCYRRESSIARDPHADQETLIQIVTRYLNLVNFSFSAYSLTIISCSDLISSSLRLTYLEVDTNWKQILVPFQGAQELIVRSEYSRIVLQLSYFLFRCLYGLHSSHDNWLRL